MSTDAIERNVTHLLVLSCLYHLMVLRGDTQPMAFLSTTLSLLIAWIVAIVAHKIRTRGKSES